MEWRPINAFMQVPQGSCHIDSGICGYISQFISLENLYKGNISQEKDFFFRGVGAIYKKNGVWYFFGETF